MDLLQTWLVIGVPALLVAGGLFAGRSRVRAWLGYAVLGALVLVLVLTPGGALSGVLVGVLVVALVATGRGTRGDEGRLEHHQERDRLTRVTDDAG